jgi:hypothetical protein
LPGAWFYCTAPGAWCDRPYGSEYKTVGAIVTSPLPGALPKLPPTSRGAFGPHLTALIALLYGRYRLSEREVVEVLADMMGVTSVWGVSGDVLASGKRVGGTLW